MSVKEELKYTETHEWVKVDGDVATIGISDYAQEKLGDVVFVELPMVGDEVEKGTTSGAIESAKAVGDLNMPVSGEIVEANEALESEPEILNNSPYEDGWIIKVKLSDPSELDSLLTADQYKSTLDE